MVPPYNKKKREAGLGLLSLDLHVVVECDYYVELIHRHLVFDEQMAQVVNLGFVGSLDLLERVIGVEEDLSGFLGFDPGLDVMSNNGDQQGGLDELELGGHTFLSCWVSLYAQFLPRNKKRSRVRAPLLILELILEVAGKRNLNSSCVVHSLCLVAVILRLIQHSLKLRMIRQVGGHDDSKVVNLSLDLGGTVGQVLRRTAKPEGRENAGKSHNFSY